MPRRELCPQCGCKRIAIQDNSKKCEACGYQWSGRIGRKTSRKGRTRF